MLPEAHGDVRLLGPEQISDGEGGEAQKAPLTKREREREMFLSYIKLGHSGALGTFYCSNPDIIQL